MTSTGNPPPATPRAHPPAGQAGNGHVQVSGSRLARQRRPSWIAVGVALMALAVLANVYLFQSSSHLVSVVRVARDVAIGQQITRGDLTTTSMTPGLGVRTIPARQLSALVGLRAAVDLRTGTLLAASEVTTQLTPRPGQALVSVAVKPSQLPPEGLPPGSQIRVVSTPATQSGTGPGTAGQTSTAPVPDVPAVVDEVGGPDTDDQMTVALLVADGDAGTVARQAATGQIALVLLSRGAR